VESTVQPPESDLKREIETPSKRRVGIFGGTFDPPHLGHLSVACAARDQLELDEVLLVVAGDPWQKRDRVLAPALLRLELTELLIAGESRLRVDGREVTRSGPTYSIETVEELFSEAQDGIEITLIVGADTARGIETWHRASELSQLVDLAIAPRPGSRSVSLSEKWRAKFLVGLENPCASTDLRDSNRDSTFLSKCLPKSILLRLGEEGLYAVRDGN